MPIIKAESVIILLLTMPTSLTPQGAILGCEPTDLCQPPQICCGSCCETEKQLCFALLLPEAVPGSASNLFQPLIGMAESTLLYGLQL